MDDQKFAMKIQEQQCDERAECDDDARQNQVSPVPSMTSASQRMTA